MVKINKIILGTDEPGINPDSKELAMVIVNRLGLNPRKKGSTEHMYNILLELYERVKKASQSKNPIEAVMTVEEMATYARISRQTMYEYLDRWLILNLITKTTYIDQNGKVVIGYRLNGNTLESTFEKVKVKINTNLQMTEKYISELQKIIKNEKISKAQKEKTQTK